MRGIKYAIIMVLLFGGAMGFWWIGLNHYKALQHEVSLLNAELLILKNQAVEAERVIAAMTALERRVLDARQKADGELAKSLHSFGSDRIDKLERLLEADRARRDGATAGSVNGAVPGAGIE